MRSIRTNRSAEGRRPQGRPGPSLGRLAVVGAALLSIAACGGTDAAGGTPAPSREAFLQQGNAICAAGNAKMDAASEQLEIGPDGEPTMESVGAFLHDAVIPNVAGQIDGLRALRPPEELKADFDSLIADADAALEDLRALVDQGVEVFFAAPDPFAEVDARATAMGLTECGEDGGGEPAPSDPAFAEYCDLVVEVKDQPGLPTAEQVAAYARLAPDAIAEPVATITSIYAEHGGDRAAILADPEAGPTIDELTAFEKEACGL